MKVIFLDHDGVICLADQWGSRKKTGQTFDRFDPKAVKVLNSIVEETGCEIVVTSTWRRYCDLEYMQNLYTDRGIIRQPVDFTLDLENVWDPNDDFNEYKDSDKLAAGIRVKEINWWLKDHPEVTHWVAIDDLDLSKAKSFVHTKYPREGIKQTGIKEKIIKALNDLDN